MRQHHRSSYKPTLNRHGAHAEPSRLEQIEEALHRLSKKVGKLNRELKDLKAHFEHDHNTLREQVEWLAEESDGGQSDPPPEPPPEGDGGQSDPPPDPPPGGGGG